jgi:hypothetical protein
MRRIRHGAQQPLVRIELGDRAILRVQDAGVVVEDVEPAVGVDRGLDHLLTVNKEAGPRVAAIISIVETCRRLSLPLRDYLGSVLPGLANVPINRVAELTPRAWAASI